MAINFTASFDRSIRKIARRQPELIQLVIEKILLFNNDINHPSLELHKLSGNLKGHWSFSIDYDVRIIFRYTNDGNILFVDIGTHDQVY